MNSVPFYFIIISAVICCSFVWIYLRSIKSTFETRAIMDLSIIVLFAGFLGARMTHVLYEYPLIYMQEPHLIFDFGRGGYVYYGGLLAGMLAGWAVLKKRKVLQPLTYFDFFTPILSLGYALGRMACLAAGCCYGPEILGTWGTQVVDDFGQLHYHHPTPLYASIVELIIFSFVILLEKKLHLLKKYNLHFSGAIFFIWLNLHSFSRFIIEFWRADYRGPQYIFSISGWISLVLFSFSLAFLIKRSRSIKS